MDSGTAFLCFFGGIGSMFLSGFILGSESRPGWRLAFGLLLAVVACFLIVAGARFLFGAPIATP